MAEGTKDFVAGVAAGVALVGVGHPFDTVKVKLQAQQGASIGPHCRGALQCTADILRTEGIRGLYKGASSSLIGVAVESSLLFGTYTHLKRVLQGSDSSGPPSLGATVVAAGIAGASVSLVLCPTELIKCRLQVQGSPSQPLAPAARTAPGMAPHLVEPHLVASSASRGVLASASSGLRGAMASTEGLGLGMAASGEPAAALLSRDAAQLAHARALGTRGQGAQLQGAQLQGAQGQVPHVQERTPLWREGTAPARPPLSASRHRLPTGPVLASGASSSARLATGSASPGSVGLRDVAAGARAATEGYAGKGYLRSAHSAAGAPAVSYSGPWDCLVKTVHNEGPQGLFKGLTATALREGIGNICFFTTYEFTKRRLTTALYPWVQGRCMPLSPELIQGHEPAAYPVELSEASTRDMESAVCEKLPPQSNGSLQQGGQGQGRAFREAVVEAVTGVASGGLAGIAFWSAVLPLDVVKTQIQTGTAGGGLSASAGVTAHLLQVYRKGGIGGLYSGLGPTLWRAFPANAAAVVAWELTARLLGVREEERE